MCNPKWLECSLVLLAQPVRCGGTRKHRRASCETTSYIPLVGPYAGQHPSLLPSCLAQLNANKACWPLATSALTSHAILSTFSPSNANTVPSSSVATISCPTNTPVRNTTSSVIIVWRQIVRYAMNPSPSHQERIPMFAWSGT